ncbi:MAG TPA: hypothetical protein VFZ21_30850 [Gemmatimonadaceae bacterium]|nr:hypothetical protein [Gemmatimonadaceae bacterium]
MTRCEYDGHEHDAEKECPSCQLYSAAVAAQGAAAQSLAVARGADPGARTWLNEYGIFGQVDGSYVEVGTREEAAPFVALTANPRRKRHRR